MAIFVPPCSASFPNELQFFTVCSFVFHLPFCVVPLRVDIEFFKLIQLFYQSAMLFAFPFFSMYFFLTSFCSAFCTSVSIRLILFRLFLAENICGSIASKELCKFQKFQQKIYTNAHWNWSFAFFWLLDEHWTHRRTFISWSLKSMKQKTSVQIR